MGVISIHALRVEGDEWDFWMNKCCTDISIHALRVEGDRRGGGIRSSIKRNFYPRPPGGGRPRWALSLGLSLTHFYPRPPGGGRLGRGNRETELRITFLSTPSGWRATHSGRWWHMTRAISIHALRVEGDYRTMTEQQVNVRFLSTPSGWRATLHGLSQMDGCDAYFYPRPPGGGRRGRHRNPCQSGRISIHALRVEGDS